MVFQKKFQTLLYVWSLFLFSSVFHKQPCLRNPIFGSGKNSFSPLFIKFIFGFYSIFYQFSDAVLFYTLCLCWICVQREGIGLRRQKWGDVKAGLGSCCRWWGVLWRKGWDNGDGRKGGFWVELSWVFKDRIWFSLKDFCSNLGLIFKSLSKTTLTLIQFE